MNAKFPEVAHHNPAGLLVGRQIAAITPRLLIGRKNRTVGLRFPLVQVDFRAFLLDENPGRADIAVDEFGRAFACFRVIDGDCLFKADELVRLCDAIDFLQQCQPKGLCLLLLVATALPVGGKLFCRGSSLCVCHGMALRMIIFFPILAQDSCVFQSVS